MCVSECVPFRCLLLKKKEWKGCQKKNATWSVLSLKRPITTSCSRNHLLKPPSSFSCPLVLASTLSYTTCSSPALPWCPTMLNLSTLQESRNLWHLTTICSRRLSVWEHFRILPLAKGFFFFTCACPSFHPFFLPPVLRQLLLLFFAAQGWSSKDKVLSAGRPNCRRSVQGTR